MSLPKFLYGLIGFWLIGIQCVNTQSHQEISEESRKLTDGSHNSQWARASELQQVNTTKHENKIAAIFIGVAYGKKNISTTTELTTQKTVTFSPSAHGVSGPVTEEETFTEDFKNVGDPQYPQEAPLEPIAPSRHRVQIQENFKQKISDDSTFNISLNAESELWRRVHDQLGSAWPVHLYTFSSLFLLLSVLSILKFIKEITCWNGFPSIKRAVLVTAITGVTTTRGALLFIDPYGTKQVLSPALESSLFSSAVPCLTLALSAFLSLFPERSGIKTFSIPNWILFLISGALIVSSIAVGMLSFWMSYQQLLEIMQSVILASVAVWGLILCFCYVVLLARIERNASQNYHKKTSAFYHKKVRIAIRYGAASAFAQLFLSGLIVYSLVGPHEVPGSSPLFTWAWWFQHSLARLLEVILCACLLVASYMMSTEKTDAMKRSFGVLGLCCGTVTRDIHPSVSMSRQALNVFTVSRAQSAADYVTADFQLVWGKNGNTASNQQSVPSTFTVHRAKVPEKNPPPSETRRYCTINPKIRNDRVSQEQVYSTIDESKDSSSDPVVINEYNYCRTQPRPKTISQSEASRPRNHYWSPSLPLKPYLDLLNRTYVSLDEMSDVNTASQNEMPVDYLTDPSSSMDDGLSTTSESLPGRWNPVHTLPSRGFSSFLPTTDQKRELPIARASLK